MSAVVDQPSIRDTPRAACSASSRRRPSAGRTGQGAGRTPLCPATTRCSVANSWRAQDEQPPSRSTVPRAGSAALPLPPETPRGAVLAASRSPSRPPSSRRCRLGEICRLQAGQGRSGECWVCRDVRSAGSAGVGICRSSRDGVRWRSTTAASDATGRGVATGVTTEGVPRLQRDDGRRSYDRDGDGDGACVQTESERSRFGRS